MSDRATCVADLVRDGGLGLWLAARLCWYWEAHDRSWVDA